MRPTLADVDVRPFVRLAREGDVAARNVVIEANIGLLYIMAARSLRRRPSTTLDAGDLAGYGVAGIVRAIERFDDARPTAFGTYAGLWIWQRIQAARLKFEETIRRPVWMHRAAARAARGLATPMPARGREYARIAALGGKAVGSGALDRVAAFAAGGQRDADETLEAIVGRLEGRSLAIVVMRLDGLKNDEIAAALGISRRSVENRLRRMAIQFAEENVR